MLLEKDIEEQFGVSDITSQEMHMLIEQCGKIYQGRPSWVNEEDNIKTINFAKVICSETARLTTLAIGVQFNENPRGQWLQQQFDGSYFRLRHWVEYGNVYGTIILKPTGQGIDMFLPSQFAVTSVNASGEIDGIVFKDTYVESGFHYTRLEYHRFIEGVYAITNKAFKSATTTDKGVAVKLELTKWNGLLEEIAIENIDKPLFGVYRTAEANNVDLDSPLGLSLFKEAIEELKDLDIAYSRCTSEIFESKRIALVDDRLLSAGPGNKISNKKLIEKMPRFIRNAFSSEVKDFFQEINPTLNTEQRVVGINQQLDMVGFKAGYSPGYFKFDGRSGAVTATQVEADDRRTIQLIKDHRDKLEDCLNSLIYALNVFADLYNFSPTGEYEATYSFGDITYSYEFDKLAWWKYRIQGDVPPWLYFVKFEGMSESEAKEMVDEAQAELETPNLFEEE